jgi:hypothetical protein
VELPCSDQLAGGKPAEKAPAAAKPATMANPKEAHCWRIFKNSDWYGFEKIYNEGR